ncbi:MAG: hypothetical protein Q7R40_20115 [Phaeospirillum sp.]|nr:hypothetical protein [Phaeospirillum sp.]
MSDTHAKILALYGEAQKAAGDIAQALPSISVGGGSGAAALSGAVPSPGTSTAAVCNANTLVDRPSAPHIAGQAYALVARNIGRLLAMSAGHVAAAGAVLSLLVRLKSDNFALALFSFVVAVLAANAIMMWIRLADGRDCGGFLAYFGLGKRMFKVMVLAIGFNVATSLPFFALEAARFPEFVFAGYSIVVAYLMFRLFGLYLVSIALDRPQAIGQIWNKGRENLLRLLGVLIFCMVPGLFVGGVLFRIAAAHDQALALGVAVVAVVAVMSSLAALGVGLQKLDESL